MSPESALTFFIAIFIFGVTPGPGVFAILARAMVDGARACTLLAFGMVIADISYLVLACLGLATIAEHWNGLFTVIRIVGAAYLLYLGYKLFTSKPDLTGQQDEQKSGNGRGALISFGQGFLISASNPKVILFYIAFLPTFMDLSALTHQAIALAAGLTLIALMAGLMLIAACAAWASSMLRSPRAIQRLNRGAGGIMMGAGVYLAARN
ncbi:LysE family translocator [Marinobacterium arenosum]|uniref:LysE family translocator n=1 Tax=Marinobacterium arenosum TaxID=2862496 RepID=UPI001C977036|nr:LysE family translocator [Marinobacterium arenosum]MBY4678772.1 LysE family translocator [Marinobacterium arenosum]